LDNKTILITGSTDGIGKETALELAQNGHQVILHGRDRQRLQQAKDEIERISGHPVAKTILADFNSLANVKVMADQILQEVPHLDVLINNAGLYLKERIITRDGFEMTFQVNHLAPFLLTNLLLPLLKKSTPARIVTVTSALHSRAILDFENLQGEKTFNGLEAYALSKLGNLYMSLELAERLAGSGISSNCLHPGGVDTKMLRAAMGTQGIPVQEGAKPSIYLATSEEVEGLSGKYFYHSDIGIATEIGRDVTARKKFWRVSEELVRPYLK
jgi:NAD(P)-dependent dehydrogenase (short-subunit alcohol dehydrogenase family)